MGPELFDQMVTRQYSEGQAARLMRNVMSAIYFMHCKGYAHRDLKPENILLKAPVPKGLTGAASSLLHPALQLWLP